MSRDFFREREYALGEKVVEAYLIAGGSASEIEKRVEAMLSAKRTAGLIFQARSAMIAGEVCLIVSNKSLTDAECANAKSLALTQGNRIDLSEETQVLKAFLITGGTGSERVSKLFQLAENESFAYSMVGYNGRSMSEDETLGLLLSNKEVTGDRYSKEFIEQLAGEQGNKIDLTPMPALQ